MKWLCKIGIHNITEKCKDETFIYKFCPRCKTLFLEWRWSTILRELFSKKEVKDENI